MVVRYVQSGRLADFDAVRRDIHVQRHFVVRNDMHRHVLAVRDRGLHHVVVGGPVGIAEVFGINDVFALQAPDTVALDNGFDVAVEEDEIVVFQL